VKLNKRGIELWPGDVVLGVGERRGEKGRKKKPSLPQGKKAFSFLKAKCGAYLRRVNMRYENGRSCGL